MPPAAIRRATRLHPATGRSHPRTFPHWQRLEKLLEDALIKLSSVATDIMGVSGRDMIEALIAGQRDPQGARRPGARPDEDQARRPDRGADGRFDDHHAELARMLLDQIDALTAQIDTLTTRIDQLLAAMPEAQPVDPRRDGPTSGPRSRLPTPWPNARDSPRSNGSTKSPASANTTHR